MSVPSYSPISNLEYDLLTVLQSKAKTLQYKTISTTNSRYKSFCITTQSKSQSR